MITFTEHLAMLRVLHDKQSLDGDITITRAELQEETAKLQQMIADSSNSLHDMNDTIIDALDVLWKESFTNKDIKFAYETLMPVVMHHYNNGDVAKLEYFEELKLALELYARVVGNTGHSIERQTAQELYNTASVVLTKIKNNSC